MKHSEIIHFYTHGACDSFALAMSKMYDVKIKVIISKDNEILHAWLVSKNGTEFDARGFVTEGSMVSQYTCDFKYRIEVMSHADLEDLIGEGEWELEAKETIVKYQSFYRSLLDV